MEVVLSTSIPPGLDPPLQHGSELVDQWQRRVVRNANLFCSSSVYFMLCWATRQRISVTRTLSYRQHATQSVTESFLQYYAVWGPGIESRRGQLCLSRRPLWYAALGTGCAHLYCSTYINLHRSGVAKSSTSCGWGDGGNDSSATLYDAV